LALPLAGEVAIGGAIEILRAPSGCVRGGECVERESGGQEQEGAK
jgi:hypothetical protein